MNYPSLSGSPYPRALLEAIFTRWPDLNNGYDAVAAILWDMQQNPIQAVASTRTLSSWLDNSLFPNDMVEYSFHLASKSRIDNVGCLFAMLGGINNALRGVYYVTPEEDWKEPCIDYWLILAPPGMMKTNVERMLRAPFDSFFETLSADFTAHYGDKKNISERHKFCQQQVKRYRDKLISKLTDPSPEAMQEVFLKSEEYRTQLMSGFADAVPPRLFWQSGTLIGLAEAMSEQYGCLGIITSEESFLTENLLIPKPDQELFLRCWDQGKYDRTVSKKVSEIKNPTLPIMMLAQDAVGHALFSNKYMNSRGASARFLSYWASSSNIIRVSNVLGRPYEQKIAKINAEEVYKYKITKLITRCWQLRKKGCFTGIKLDIEAKNILSDFRSKLRLRLDSGEFDFLADWLRKAHGFLVRLAGDIHCWNNPECPECSPINGSEMNAAVALMHILEDHACYSFSPNEVAMCEDAKLILRYIKNHPNLPRWFDSCKFYQNIRGIDAKRVSIALEYMERWNQLVAVPKKRGGHFVILNPKVHEFLMANNV